MTITEYLGDRVDSHDIVDLTAIVNGLVKEGVAELVGTAESGTAFRLKINGKPVTLRGQRLGEIERLEDPRKVGPKGAYINPGADRENVCVGGYSLSAQLAKQLLGNSPGAAYFGRGTAFRADMAGLRAAGW